MPFRRAAWALPPMARISKPQRVYFMKNQKSTSRTKRKDHAKMDARAKEGRQARRGNKIGRLDRIHGGMPETKNQEADDLGRDGIHQQGGDGFVHQANGFEITGDKSPQRAAKHAQQHHQRQQDPCRLILKGQRAPGGECRADIQLSFPAHVDQPNPRGQGNCQRGDQHGDHGDQHFGKSIGASEGGGEDIPVRLDRVLA